MGWMVQGSNPIGVEIFSTCPDRLWSLLSLLYNGYWEKRTGVMVLMIHPHLVPRFMAGYRVNFTLHLLQCYINLMVTEGLYFCLGILCGFEILHIIFCAV